MIPKSWSWLLFSVRRTSVEQYRTTRLYILQTVRVAQDKTYMGCTVMHSESGGWILLISERGLHLITWVSKPKFWHTDPHLKLRIMKSTWGCRQCWEINLCYHSTDSSGMLFLNKIPRPDALQRNFADATRKVWRQLIGHLLPITAGHKRSVIRNPSTAILPQKYQFSLKTQNTRG